MSGPSPKNKNERPIEGMADLVAHLASGEKPKAAWRLGTEHEKFVYRTSDLKPPSYFEPNGIRALLKGLERFGWQPVVEGDNVIALQQGMASISLEPAGQFELSGAPLETLHQTCSEVGAHLQQCRTVGEELGLGFLGLGFTPIDRRDEMPVMPKGRYAIMMRHMPRVGSLGLDMMQRTCTVQVNLDYATEADMVQKFRTSLALQPIATALFANSPFSEGKPNGFLSYRSHIWTDTDPQRTGMLGFVFEDGFSYERYVDYMLDVPMYFVYRDGTYIDAAGQSFRDFMAGALPALPGELPTLSDWKDHLSTAFPEVRLKSYLEMRGADSGPWARICALPALWVGLLYDQAALDAAWDLVKHWTPAEQQALRDAVPRLGLKAEIAGRSVRDVARDVLRIADAGLKARARHDQSGGSEQGFLNTLWDVVETGKTPADTLLELYHGRWAGDLTQAYAEQSY